MIIFNNYGHLSTYVCIYSVAFVLETVEWKIHNENLCFALRSFFLSLKCCHNDARVWRGVFTPRLMFYRLFCLGLAKS